MTLDGYGVEQIATALTDDRILTPMNYWRSKGLKRGGKKNTKTPTYWRVSTIVKILSLQEYCGDIVNFKTYSKSYKNKKRIPNTEENMAIFRDVNEPVVERAEWEKVKAKRGTTRKRQAKDGNKSIFSGFLVCADCGGNLNYHFNQKNPDIKYFNCANNNNHGDCPTNHYIRLDFLEMVVLAEIRRLTAFARDYEDNFAVAVMGHSTKVVELEYERKQRELKSLLTRDGELDALFERIYEDNLNGKLTDERYAKMAKRYETEQTTIAERVKILKAELRKADTRMMSSEMFVSTVRRYADAKTLTQRMISELIDRIEVFQAEKVDGEHKQRLRIHYNGVGVFDIPDALKLPETEVRVQTRKGVAICYTPEKQIAS
jgi:hypothetical protein